MKIPAKQLVRAVVVVVSGGMENSANAHSSIATAATVATDSACGADPVRTRGSRIARGAVEISAGVCVSLVMFAVLVVAVIVGRLT